MAIYPREDPRTALPQLEKQIDSLFDSIYPIGSWYETSDEHFNPNASWNGTWELEEAREVIVDSGEKTVTAAQFYNLVTITLLPNTEYMVFGRVGTDSGSTFQVVCSFTVSGAESYTSRDTRTQCSAGQGVVGFCHVITGDTDATLTLRSYGYYTTSHKEHGTVVAIPLNASKNNKWHRVK